MKTKFTLFALLITCVLSSSCVKHLKQVGLKEVELDHKNYIHEGTSTDLSFAYASPELVIEADISQELKNGLAERLKYMGSTIACHLNRELDKIIVSKGFNITNRYRNLRYMTFSEKRNTTALFYPKIIIKVIERSEISLSGPHRFSTDGVLEVKADVNIIMQEPMSEEIIWIKSIPVDDITDSFTYNNAYWAGRYGERLKLNTSVYRVGRGQKGHVPENLVEPAKILDSFFLEIDQKIIDSTLHFVEPVEFEFLNSDIKKLKKLNRY